MHQSLLNCFKPLRRGAGVGHNRTGSLKKAQQHPHFPFQSLDIILELVLCGGMPPCNMQLIV